MVYDFLAGVKKSERRRMLTKEETMKKVPIVKQDGLKGGGLYVEYRTDDARLTIEVMKSAAQKGAVIANYIKAESFIYNDKDQISGAEVVDLLTGKKIAVKAKKIVNATGPWVDHLREADGSKDQKHLRLSKGVHIVFDQSVFPLNQALYFDTPDGRMVFAIPRDGKTYMGTTDTFYEGDPADLQASKADRDYLLNILHDMFPDLSVTEDDIESSWAGVRPLIYEEGKDPSEISRKDEIWESKKGLITIAGGKLTGYRKMAETVVDLVVKKLGADGYNGFSECITKKLPISGGDVGGSSNLEYFLLEQVKKAEALGLSKEEGRRLATLYGTNVDHVFAFLKESDDERLRVLHAQLMYAIQHEMVIKPVDFFIRRTGDLFFNISRVKEWKTQIISEMASIFEWTEEERINYEEELNQEINRASNPSDI
jgi:glycerol-3-phosphate dehydrogenase